MIQPVSRRGEQGRPDGVLEVDEQLVEDISALLDSGERAMVLNLVADLYAADLARLISHLPLDEARQLFHWLPLDEGADVLADLDDSFRAELLEEVHPERLAELLDELDTDDAADVLADLDEAVAQRVLPELEDAEHVRALLDYDEETAGGLMAAEFVAVPGTWTVAETTEEVRRNAETVEEIFAVFVVDERGHLEGVVTLKRLLLSPSEARIGEIMDPDVFKVKTEVDQEEVARIMERYDLVSLPVVDGAGRLVGRITIDDVVDVIREEAEEDIQLMSGVTGGEEPTDSVLRISRGRLPWLLIGLFGAGLSATVIGTFEEGLKQAIVLTIFIPIVTAMGGNAAVQSAAIAVQGLTSGAFWPGDVFKRIGKELNVALVNGLVIAGLLCVVVVLLGLGEVGPLALTLGLTMLTVILVATVNGALIPFLLKRLGVDPASAMGPFVTTLNDIIGLTIYFLVATTFYLR